MRTLFLLLAASAPIVSIAGCGASTYSSATNNDGGPLADGSAGDAASGDGATGADWVLTLDPTQNAGAISPALLGHYDLSGAMFDYADKPQLISALQGAGFAEWRVGVGRWEAVTWMFPTLTSGGACAIPIAQAAAPNGATDDTLIAMRDWFVLAGNAAATAADVTVDANYKLDYVNRVLDTAKALGASPFLSIDLMPRALAKNKAPNRTDCNYTGDNAVSNAPPADPDVHSSAVAGLVQRILKARDVPYVEFGNEPDEPFFWSGSLSDFDTSAVYVLVKLDALRTALGKSFKIGTGGYANVASAVATLQGLDQSPVAGKNVPLDFLSFHAYGNDPLDLVSRIGQVAAARDASAHYKNIELVLSEWGPDLTATGGDVAYASSMDPPLHVATVLARGAALGVTHSHHALFYDYYPGLTWGLVDPTFAHRPIYWAYALLSSAIGAGATRLTDSATADGALDGGNGAYLAVRGASGVRVVFVNRGSAPRSARVDLAPGGSAPTAIRVFDDPASAPRAVTPSGNVVTIPPRAIALVSY